MVDALHSQKSTLSRMQVFFRPEWVFLVMALLFGVACLILTPPLQVPDEGPHFFRAYLLSEGHLFAVKSGDITGDYLPETFEQLKREFLPLGMHPERKASWQQLRAAFQLTLAGEGRKYQWFSNTAIYPPLPYVPQALGIRVARSLSSSVLVSYYMGRLFNLLASAAVLFVAIRRTPIGPWIFVTLALTPMSLFLMASLSADALTNSVSFLLSAHILRCACGPELRFSRRHVLSLVALSVAIALMKPGYFLLILSYFLIPSNKFGSRLRYAAVFLGVFFVGLFAGGAWGLAARNIYSPAVPGKIDPTAQLRHMSSHPSAFLGAVLRSSSIDALETLHQYVGVLGVLDTPVPNWALALEWLILAATVLTGFGLRTALTIRQAGIALLTAYFTYLALLVGIHLTWDKVGSTEFIDVQGRYFIPLSPLASLGLAFLGTLSLSRIAWLPRFVPLLASATIPCVLAAMLITLHRRYFEDNPRATAEREFDEGQQLLKNNHSQEALAHLLKAVRLDPDHAKAHFNIAVLRTPDQPLQAIEHYRTASRLEPDNFQIHNNLANILAQQGFFDEAIQHYRTATQIAPDPVVARQNLHRALQVKEKLERALQKIGTAIETRAREEETARQYIGTAKDGFYLKPNQSEIVAAEGRPLFPTVRYLWRWPPPSNDELRLFDANGKILDQPQRVPFYACATSTIGPRRVFVFPTPVNAILLHDEEISWFYQMRMQDLSESERQREQTYRERNKLRFPLQLHKERVGN